MNENNSGLQLFDKITDSAPRRGGKSLEESHEAVK